MICNAMILILTTILVIQSVMNGARDKEITAGHTFRYFTTDSNILCAISALLVLPYNLRAMETGAALELPMWLTLVKYTGCVVVMVTFLTVMLFLGPTKGYKEMLSDSSLYMHLVGPLLALFSFCLWEGKTALLPVQALVPVILVLIYGIVYFSLVIVSKKWEDFYGFNRDGKWWISVLGMLVAAFLISFGVLGLHNTFAL